MELPDASKEQLQDAWKAWMQEAGETVWALAACLAGWVACSLLAAGSWPQGVLLALPSSCVRARHYSRVHMYPLLLLLHHLSMQWRRRGPSHPATRPARPCGSSASK